jgi:hypothetical protein
VSREFLVWRSPTTVAMPITVQRRRLFLDVSRLEIIARAHLPIMTDAG